MSYYRDSDRGEITIAEIEGDGTYYCEVFKDTGDYRKPNRCFIADKIIVDKRISYQIITDRYYSATYKITSQEITYYYLREVVHRASQTDREKVSRLYV